MVAGGVGTAPVYPIARAFHEVGSRVISIQGARTKELLFWTEKLACGERRAHHHHRRRQSGPQGAGDRAAAGAARAATPQRRIGCVYAIGPAVMMKFCAKTTEPFGVKTVVSLNSVMVDGTGMCGGCRVDLRRQDAVHLHRRARVRRPPGRLGPAPLAAEDLPRPGSVFAGSISWNN